MVEDASGPPPELRDVAEIATELGLELRASIRPRPLGSELGRRLDSWFQDGRHGEMAWLERARDQLDSLQAWKPWTRSALLFTASYAREAGGFRGGGRVARYALGRDYHNELGRRLQKLGRRLKAEGLALRSRAVVDAAPVLEREWGLVGGHGFRGKNTLLLDPVAGPWQFLAELLVDAELAEWRPDPPAASCGSCTACLDDCPTEAFTGPWLLDPRRCISYLTIEHRGPIPRALRTGMGDWVFGCDVCLEVCPFGGKATDQAERWSTAPALEQLSLEDLLGLDRERFEQAFVGSPVRRAGWAGLLRNACVALGNLGRGEPALSRALEHPEALVRGHAAWALGQLGVASVLEERMPTEAVPWVREELQSALGENGA